MKNGVDKKGPPVFLKRNIKPGMYKPKKFIPLRPDDLLFKISDDTQK